MDARTDIFAFGCALRDGDRQVGVFSGASRRALIATILRATQPISSLQPTASSPRPGIAPRARCARAIRTDGCNRTRCAWRMPEMDRRGLGRWGRVACRGQLNGAAGARGYGIARRLMVLSGRAVDPPSRKARS